MSTLHNEQTPNIKVGYFHSVLYKKENFRIAYNCRKIKLNI